jgi:hypothetical protein
VRKEGRREERKKEIKKKQQKYSVMSKQNAFVGQIGLGPSSLGHYFLLSSTFLSFP